MRVAFEASSTLTSNFRGAQRYIFDLIGAMAALDEPDLTFQMLLRFARFGARGLKPVTPWPTRWYLPGPWPAVPFCDVVHGLDMRVPPTPNRMLRICTMHDTAYWSMPGPSDRTRTQQRRARLFRRTARVADWLIAVSEASKTEFLSHFEFPAERIEVIHHGVSAVFLDDSTTAREEWQKQSARPFLMVFCGDVRKNTERLLKGFATASESKGFELRVIGKVDDETREMVAGLPRRDAIRFVDKLDDEQLARMYRNSRGLLFASVLEGFGLPILEAMACHAPVLTSNRGAMAEVAGGHAVLVDPESIDDIADGIDRLCGLPEQVVNDAALYARRFTWQRTAKQTLAMYRRDRR